MPPLRRRLQRQRARARLRSPRPATSSRCGPRSGPPRPLAGRAPRPLRGAGSRPRPRRAAASTASSDATASKARRGAGAAGHGSCCSLALDVGSIPAGRPGARPRRRPGGPSREPLRHEQRSPLHPGRGVAAGPRAKCSGLMGLSARSAHSAAVAPSRRSRRSDALARPPGGGPLRRSHRRLRQSNGWLSGPHWRFANHMSIENEPCARWRRHM